MNNFDSFSGKPSDINAKVNEQVKVQCKLSGAPSPTIVWLKDGQVVEATNNITIQTDFDGTQTLLIKSAQLDDKGVYTCQATNIGGTTEVKINVNVQQTKPSLKSDLTKDVFAQAGESVSLSVQASGTSPQCKWYKNDEEIIQTVEEEYEIIEEEETYTLLIKRAQPKDSGDYQAVLSNDAGQVKSKKVKVNIQKAPELKSKPDSVVTVKEGEPARFACEFEGSPMPKVVWLRDGKPFTAKDGFDIKTDGVAGTSVLTINQTTAKHSGPITLRLDNGISPPIDEAFLLQVETKPQLLQKPPATCEAYLNQTASITFKCLATPKPTIRLFKNEIEVFLTGDHYELVPSDTDATLYEIRIKDVRSDDEGTYRIQVENALGSCEALTQVTTVDNVSIKPLTQSIKTDLKQHETLTLEYVVDGRPRPEMIFMKDGKEIKPSDRIKITFDETTNVFRLVVSDVGQEDQGTYSLVIKNKLGKQESEPIKINVTAPITVKTSLPESIDAVLGEQTTLSVEASGKSVRRCSHLTSLFDLTGIPQPKVTWLFNGQPLKSSAKHKIETPKENPNITTLTITKLDTSDTGRYTAVIDNGLEKIESQSALTVHARPKLESKLEPNLTFNIGEQGQIPIRLSGENNTITWFKDSQPITFDDRVRLITDATNSYQLIIDDLRPEDKGLYSMHIENKGGALDLKTTVTIKEQKPQLLSDLNDAAGANVGKIGEEFFLEIRAQGKPRPQVTWLFNGQELPSDSTDYKFIVSEDDLYRLVFQQFSERYLGEYQAVITSTAGTLKTKKAKVTGQQQPIFIQEPPRSIQVKTGEKVTVECTAKGQPTPKITWLRDGKVLSNKDGFDIKIDQATGQASFSIPSASMKHIGKYECRVENQYGTHSAEIDIDVLGKTERGKIIIIFSVNFLAAPVVQQKMQDFEVARGQEVTMSVTADGSPLPTCTWYHNEQLIQAEPDRVLIIDDGATHTLKLLDVQLTDDGQYKVSSA